jgi:hypothetical protein
MLHLPIVSDRTTGGAEPNIWHRCTRVSARPTDASDEAAAEERQPAACVARERTGGLHGRGTR